MKSDRRTILGTGLALAGLAGMLTGLSPSANAATASAGSRFASFGWEVVNLDNNGADVFFEVTGNMVVNSIETDVAFVLTSPPSSPGFSEVLCRAAVSPNAPPRFYPNDPGAGFISPQSPNFSKTHIHNPNHLNVGDDGYLLQNIFFSVILKSWVPDTGAGSSTSRHVSTSPGLILNTGDYLVFNMSHAGVAGDCEMQVVLQYTLT